MSATAVAAKTQAFDMVQIEIETTIKQAEQNLISFQENRESSEDLQNCIDYLNQLRGIFILVEIQGAVILCQEAVSLANEVPIGASDDKNSLLTSLNNAFFILRRYVEYYRQYRQDHPELLLPIINELRTAQHAKPFADSHFIDIDLSRSVDYCGLIRVEAFDPGVDFEARARRLRHIYQVALLGLLKDKNIEVNLKLLFHSAKGLARLCKGGQLSGLWCLVVIVVQAMSDRRMEMNPNRKRLFMKIEKYARELVYVGKVVNSKSAPDSIRRELIYILYLSGSHNPEVIALLDGYSLQPAEFNEQLLVENRRRLLGPGADVLRSLSGALQEELNYIKDKLDIIERGIDPDVTDFSVIASGMARLSSTLSMLSLATLAGVASRQSSILEGWAEAGKVPSESELINVANAVLNIEQSVKTLETSGIVSDVDLAEAKENESLHYFREAQIVLIGEAQSAIALAKRSITAYLESGWDKLHLTAVEPALDSVRGGMLMLGEVMLAKVIAACMRCLHSELIERNGKPDSNILETMADALTSLEYYIETMSGRDRPSQELLVLAEESLKSIGYSIA
ncbi:MAG: chemotaxis protein [Hahellaceae bacterium]|nr:chemotaxis protein [Hahellaceae bacterium]